MTTANDIPAALLEEARPISFTDALAPKARSGKKTETRRVITQLPFLQYFDEEGELNVNPFRWGLDCPPYQYDGRGPSCLREEGEWYANEQTAVSDFSAHHIPARYGEKGDLLWVQEGYQIKHHYEDGGVTYALGEYSADGEGFHVPLTEREAALLDDREDPYRKCPGRFMYKSLARTLLRVENWWPERVQSITEESIIAEGITPTKTAPGAAPEGAGAIVWSAEEYPTPNCFDNPQAAFRYLWDEINASRGYPWDANPFVRAIKFSPIEDPEAV